MAPTGFELLACYTLSRLDTHPKSCYELGKERLVKIERVVGSGCGFWKVRTKDSGGNAAILRR